MSPWRLIRWFIGEPSPDRWIGIGCLLLLAAAVALLVAGILTEAA